MELMRLPVLVLVLISTFVISACSDDKTDSPLNISLSGTFMKHDSVGGLNASAGRVRLVTAGSDGEWEVYVADADMHGYWEFPSLDVQPDDAYLFSAEVPDDVYFMPAWVDMFYGREVTGEELIALSGTGVRIELHPSDGIAYLESVDTVGENNADFPEADPTDVIYRASMFWPGVSDIIEEISARDCLLVYRDIYIYDSTGLFSAGEATEEGEFSCDVLQELEVRVALPADIEQQIAAGSVKQLSWDSYIFVKYNDDGVQEEYFTSPSFYIDTTFVAPQQ